MCYHVSLNQIKGQPSFSDKRTQIQGIVCHFCLRGERVSCGKSPGQAHVACSRSTSREDQMFRPKKCSVENKHSDGHTAVSADDSHPGFRVQNG